MKQLKKYIHWARYRSPRILIEDTRTVERDTMQIGNKTPEKPRLASNSYQSVRLVNLSLNTVHTSRRMSD